MAPKDGGALLCLCCADHCADHLLPHHEARCVLVALLWNGRFGCDRAAGDSFYKVSLVDSGIGLFAL